MPRTEVLFIHATHRLEQVHTCRSVVLREETHQIGTVVPISGAMTPPKRLTGSLLPRVVIAIRSIHWIGVLSSHDTLEP